jgi:hypothetical protein
VLAGFFAEQDDDGAEQIERGEQQAFIDIGRGVG